MRPFKHSRKDVHPVELQHGLPPGTSSGLLLPGHQLRARPADGGAAPWHQAHQTDGRRPVADPGHPAQQQHAQRPDRLPRDRGTAGGVPRGDLLDRPLLQRPAQHRPGISALSLGFSPSSTTTPSSVPVNLPDGRASFLAVLSPFSSVLTTYYNLHHLNLHGNSIQQLSEVDKLAVLPHLRSLTLHGNPIEEEKGYR
ncbi:leucine-rich repeat-containing protein 51 isoform X2 [Varanus komodoensis]|nr:leucine-rich repeat-containing protein 51 isoform X2 [Varanus komodoensis]